MTSDDEADHPLRYPRQGGFWWKTVANVLRSDARGNLRLLISSGTSAQELRIITTAGNFLAGESLRCELNEMLSEVMDW